MTLEFFVFLLFISEVFGDIHKISWSQVIVDKSAVTFQEELQLTAVKAANLCAKTDDCDLVCELEDGYGLSKQKIGAEYFEGSSGGNQYNCWTKMPLAFTPERLSEDGLYYHLHLRGNRLTGGQCVKACRRIPDYRLAILRTEEQFEAFQIKYGTVCFVGLIKKMENGIILNNQFEWIDGTPYESNMRVTSNDASTRYFLHYGNAFDDTSGAYQCCLCQGNPDYIEW